MQIVCRMLGVVSSSRLAKVANSSVNKSTAGWQSAQIAISSGSASRMLRLTMVKPADLPAPNTSRYSVQFRARIATRSCCRTPRANNPLARRYIRPACSANADRPSNITAVCAP